MRDRAGNFAVTMLALGMAACGGTPEPQLVTINEVIPAHVDFSGRWQLRDAADGEAAGRNLPGADAGFEPIVGTAGRSRPQRSDGPSVNLFLEMGSRLKITQTVHGLFISFDRSVVEEYRFREHRTVNVGPIEAERVSGWDNGRYVIRTADDKGAVLTETYALAGDGAELVRTIRIDSKGGVLLSMRQEFDRRD